MTDWLLFTPEIFALAVCGVFLLLATLTRENLQRDRLMAGVFSAVGVGVCLAMLYQDGDLFSGVYRVDLFSQVFKTMLFAGFFLVTCLCSELSGIEPRYRTEFFLLLSVCTLSMMMLVSAAHVLTMVAALELSSYSLYILVFLQKDRDAGIRAALRYFLVGAVATAVMFFGLALLYGATGAAYLVDLARILPESMDSPWVVLGLAMALCGFFFKLAVFPFHFWAPDVYQGAANQVGAYVATASKVAAAALLVRMVALAGDSAYMVQVLAVLAIISMTVGNLSAIVQKDLKRLLAYSSVAQAGYVLIGLLAVTPAGYGAVVFYALTILVLKFTCFFVVVHVSPGGGNPTLGDLAGLHRRSPLMALALMTALFGLGGIPPTIGFSGKFFLFWAAMEKGHLVLVIIAMFNVVISLYYYLLVVKAAYLDEPAAEPPPLVLSPPLKLLAVALLLLMVFGGIFPTPLISLAGDAVASLF